MSDRDQLACRCRDLESPAVEHFMLKVFILYLRYLPLPLLLLHLLLPLFLHVLVSSIVSIQHLPLDFSLLLYPLHLHYYEYLT